MRKLQLVLAGTAFVLAGCAGRPVMHSAFDDITSEPQVTKTPLVTYRNVISLNGLMPLHVPGMLFLEPQDAGSAGSGDKSPSLLLAVSPKRSMVVQATYAESDAASKVKTLQTAYLTLRGAAIAEVAARIHYGLLEALKQTPGDDTIRQALGFSAESATPVNVSAQVAKAGADLAVAQKTLADARNALFSGLDDNMVIANWTRKDQFQGLASVLPFLQANASRDSTASGVLILGGVRVVNVMFGEDLYCMAQNAQSNPAQWAQLRNVSVTTNLVQAQAVAYVSDLDVTNSLAASLKLTQQQLQALLKSGKAGLGNSAESLSASALVASAMSVSNVGRLVNPTIQSWSFRFFPPRTQVADLKAEFEDANHYITVDVTRAQFTNRLLGVLAKAAHDVRCRHL